MSKIRIKNFGPIKEGYLENDGWIDIGKVTVFIGNQGSGKSTIAKAISQMTWLEKALVRGDFEAPQSLAAIQKGFENQSLKNYFKKNTSIEYRGDAYSINYIPNSTDLGSRRKDNTKEYKLPKIMYVPAERNFLSVVKNAFDVTGLPEMLFIFGEELRRAQDELNNEIIELPINDFGYKYDKVKEISYVVGADYGLPLNEASSGLQSTIPLFLVSKNLAETIQLYNQGGISNIVGNGTISISQKIRMDREKLAVLNDNSISDNIKMDKIRELESLFHSKIFINIVEEPEQNLYPSSQKKILESLLEFNNMNKGNKLIMTTHSPYLINYLTLAVKAGTLKKKAEKNEQLLEKINQIVPLASTINGEDLAVFEFDEKTGTIKKLETYNGLPSDENELNVMLDEGNDLFAELLEIEQNL